MNGISVDFFGMGVGMKVNSVVCGGAGSVSVVVSNLSLGWTVLAGSMLRGVWDRRGTAGVGEKRGTRVLSKRGSKCLRSCGTSVTDTLGDRVEEMRTGAVTMFIRSSRVGTIIGGGSMVGLRP